MSDDADIYGEQSDDERYLVLANEKARSIIKGTLDGGDLPWKEVDDAPYLGLAVDRTSGLIMLCNCFDKGLVAKHWCEKCDGWHTITKKSADHFSESLKANPPPGALSTH